MIIGRTSQKAARRLTIRDILNQFFWDPRFQDRENYMISFIHRGAPGDEKTISASRIREVLHKFFVYTKRSTGEDVYIPFHRILIIKNFENGEVLYEKREK